jgi:hypothetical protein
MGASDTSRKSFLAEIWRRAWVRWCVYVWGPVGVYDSLLSQFVPEQWAKDLPRFWQVIVMAGLMPFWAWLLFLAALVTIAAMEVAYRSHHYALSQGDSAFHPVPLDTKPISETKYDRWWAMVDRMEQEFGGDGWSTEIRKSIANTREYAQMGPYLSEETKAEMNRFMGLRMVPVLRLGGEETSTQRLLRLLRADIGAAEAAEGDKALGLKQSPKPNPSWRHVPELTLSQAAHLMVNQEPYGDAHPGTPEYPHYLMLKQAAENGDIEAKPTSALYGGGTYFDQSSKVSRVSLLKFLETRGIKISNALKD